MVIPYNLEDPNARTLSLSAHQAFHQAQLRLASEIESEWTMSHSARSTLQEILFFDNF